MKATFSDIGCRVQYTPPHNTKDRSPRFGFIRDVANSFVDVALDGMTRPKYFVPEDCVELLSEDHPEYYPRQVEL